MSETISQTLKSDRYQRVRLIDVFVLAPAMIYASTYKEMPDYVRLILFVSGIATLVFNGKNFKDIEEEKNK
tara:strand:+ start:1139 stop:1351 length:213 start_codon:yes stop_codon:yes gene_type:complete